MDISRLERFFLCLAAVGALGLHGCAGKQAEPELPAHPGSAWKSGGNVPVINGEEITREGFVYESAVPPSQPLKELPRPRNEAEREAAFAKLRASGKNDSSLKQSKAHLGDLRRQMNDMLQDAPKKH